MKIGALVQANFNDRKLFVQINNKKTYDVVIEKLKKIDLLDEIIIVAPDTKENSYFKDIFSGDKDVKVFLGDHENICKRIVDCCDRYSIDIIVRLPAVKPLFDKQLLKSAVEEIITGNYDYVRHSYSVPDGLGIEVYTLEAIKKVQSKINFELDANKVLKYKPHYFMEKNLNSFRVKFIEKEYDEEKLNELRKLNKTQEERADDTFVPELLKVKRRHEFSAKYINKTDTVLDIACSSGVGCTILAPICSKVVGIDYNADSIESARKNCSCFSNVEVFTGNALELSMENTFDKIVSFETIEHIYEDYLFIVNLYKSLKENGILILSTPIRRNNINKPLNPFHVREYLPEELEDLLSRAGFIVTEKYGQEFSGEITGTIDKVVEGIVFVCKKVIFK